MLRTKFKGYFIMDAHQPPKKTKRHLGIKIVNLDTEFFPFEVHIVIEEETVEPFELEKLGCREILSNEMTYFRGQVREIGILSLYFRLLTSEILFFCLPSPSSIS